MRRLSRFRPSGIWLLVACSFALYLLFVSAELPIATHPDEPRVVRHAIAMGSGDLNPHFFYYPTLWIYVIFIGQAVAAAGGMLCGRIHGRDHLAALVFTDPSLFFVAARLLTALAGAGAVAMVWRIGRRFSPLCGWTSALVLALFGPFVWQAHYATVDVPLVLAVLVCLDACLARLERDSRRWYWWPAIAAGLAASTKYTGVVAFAPVLAMLALRRNLTRVPVAAGLGALAFFATSPFILVSFGLFRQHAGTVARGLPAAEGVGPGLLGYLRFAVTEQGWPLLLLAFAGWVMRARAPAHRDRVRVLAAFFVPYVVLIHSYFYRTPRTFLPLVPAIGLGLGWTLDEVARGTRRWLGDRPWTARLLPGLLLLVLLTPSILGTIRAKRDIAAPSAEAQTIRWFTRHVPPRNRVIVDAGTRVSLPPDSATVASRLERWRKDGSPLSMLLHRAYTQYLQTDLPERGYGLVPTESIQLNTFQSGQLRSRDYALSRLEGVRYVVLTARAFRLDDGSERARFFAAVRQAFHPVYQVTDRRGETIVVVERQELTGPS